MAANKSRNATGVAVSESAGGRAVALNAAER